MGKHKCLLRRLAMPQKELEAYYRARRAERFRSGAPVRGVGWRRWGHPLVAALLALDRAFARRRLTVLHACPAPAGKPAIYACTHVGRYDIETALELIPEQCWFFMGDPGSVYKNMDGLVLWLNGTLFTDTAYPEDRHIGKENCVNLLRQGGSLLIYPEGAWNITENLPVMPLFTGTAEMALRTGARIVPIAIEQYGRQYYANAGRPIDPAAYAAKGKRELTADLRDALATLKWEIWERCAMADRGALPPDAAAQYLESIMCQTENGYTVQEIQRTRYHTKDTAPSDAFAHLARIAPTPASAFLFGKRLTGGAPFAEK